MSTENLLTELESRIENKNISYSGFCKQLEKIQVIENIYDLKNLIMYYQTGDVTYTFANYYIQKECIGGIIKVIPTISLKETVKKLNQLRIIYQLKYE